MAPPTLLSKPKKRIVPTLVSAGSLAPISIPGSTVSTPKKTIPVDSSTSSGCATGCVAETECARRVSDARKHPSPSAAPPEEAALPIGLKSAQDWIQKLEDLERRAKAQDALQRYNSDTGDYEDLSLIHISEPTRHA